MSKRIKKFTPTLQYLAKCNNSKAKAVIKESGPQLVNCVSDICHNLLRGKVKLTSKAKKRLLKYKKHIRTVAKKRATHKTKKQIIQKGGFLSAILAPLLATVLGPVVKGIFKKR